MSPASAPLEHLQRLREAGAAQQDAVGWHYIEQLAARAQAQTGAAQALLLDKLAGLLSQHAQGLAQTRDEAAATPEPGSPLTSPLALLLREMAPPPATDHNPAGLPPFAPQQESQRVRQFRRQLRQISVQKRVSKAIAQAPQNAGPINSHMLVLRALDLMRAHAPGYLQRFMTQVDTLLSLQDAEQQRDATGKPASARVKKR